ncbi:MAG: hypothetical protein AMXMBFR13_32300 [Phycisphaerae bacterium]|jgi:hypothetical protein
MQLRARYVMAFVAVVLAILPAGCGTGGGCSDIFSIATKLGIGEDPMTWNIGSLAACEWQVLVDSLQTFAPMAGIDLSGLTIPSLTDDQAQAIADFLANNGINTPNDMLAMIESGQVGVDDIPPVLLELIPF